MKIELANVPFPAYDSRVHETPNGTQYLTEPGVVLLAKPTVLLSNLWSYIAGFKDFGDSAAQKYIREATTAVELEHLSGAEVLVMAAGQNCYLSFGESGRSTHERGSDYILKLIQSGHGSVLEHANYTFLFYGIDRAVTHELVRHRAGFAYSQVSQRYVDGSCLRFVEPPEYQEDTALHQTFTHQIDEAKQAYDVRAHLLIDAFERQGKLQGVAKRDARKMVNQSARRVLPNETEAPIVVTANVRAWRNFLDQRATTHADLSIRRPAFITGMILKMVAPALFGDYTLDEKTMTMHTEYRKV